MDFCGHNGRLGTIGCAENPIDLGRRAYFAGAGISHCRQSADKVDGAKSDTVFIA